MFAVALAAFIKTLAPTVTLEQSGMLVVAADYLGISRMPGYPVWHILAHGFARIGAGLSYHGHPNPAAAVNFMSAFWGALATGCLAWLIARIIQACVSVGLALAMNTAVFSSALLFAFSPTFWSQAVVAETHTLTVFYLLFFLSALLTWMENPTSNRDLLCAFGCGFGLSISPMLLLLIPLLLLAAGFVGRRRFFQMLGACSGFLLFIGAAFFVGWLSPAWAAGVLGTTFLVLLLSGIIPCTRRSAALLALMLLGLLPCLYLPWAAAQHPPMNSGYACTWEGFWHVLSRGQYERIVFLNPFQNPSRLILLLRWYGALVVQEFVWPLLLPGLIPLLCWTQLPTPARRALALVVLALLLFSVVVLLGANPASGLQTAFFARRLFIPSFALIALLIGLGWGLLLSYFLKPRDPTSARVV